MTEIPFEYDKEVVKFNEVVIYEGEKVLPPIESKVEVKTSVKKGKRVLGDYTELDRYEQVNDEVPFTHVKTEVKPPVRRTIGEK